MSDREDSSKLETGEISIANRDRPEQERTCSWSWVYVGKESESKENLRVSCLYEALTVNMAAEERRGGGGDGRAK